MISDLPLKKRRLVALVMVGVLVIGGGFMLVVSHANRSPVSVSLTEAQQQVPFTIPQPGWLPDGLIFQGARVASPNWVLLVYERVGTGHLYIDITHGERVVEYDYPETAGQPVMVKGVPAIYVHGGTNEQGWNPSADAGMIEWEVNGYIYLVSYFEMGLSQDNLIHIAEAIE